MKRALVSAAFAVTALVAAVTVGVSAPAAATPTVTFVEAGDQDFSSVDVLYFVDLMKKSGINVNVQAISSASSALRTVIAGQADIFLGSLPTAILAVLNGGANIKLIAANDQASDYVLVGQAGTTLSNLAGKTMAIDTPGSAGQVAAEIGLQKMGVDPSIIHYVTVGGTSARTTAILAGRVDLAPIHYPSALTAIATGKVVQLVNVGKVIGPYLQSGLIASDGWIKGNPKLVQTVVNDFINAERWAASNKFKYIAYADSHKLSAGLTDDQESKVWDFYRDTNFFGVNGGICFKYITDFAVLNWKLGTLPKPLPGRDQWLNDSFVKNYLKAHKQKTNTC